MTIQDQILALLADLQQEFGMAMVLVSHDLGVVAQNCDSVAVMYAGHVVEHGPGDGALPRAAPPVHGRPAAGAAARSPAPARARLPQIAGQTPDLARAAGGLSVPAALPVGPRRLRRR